MRQIIVLLLMSITSSALLWTEENKSLLIKPIMQSCGCINGCANNDFMWVFDGTGITAIDRTDMKQYPVAWHNDNGRISSMIGIPYGCVVGTNDGIYVWHQQKKIWEHWERGMNINDVQYDGKHLLVITDSALIAYTLNGRKEGIYTLADPISDEKFLKLSVYNDEIWIAGTYGIYNKFKDEKKVYRYQRLSADDMMPCLTVTGSYVFIGKGNTLLTMYDKLTGAQQSIIHQPHASSQFITAMHQDGQYVWMGTFDDIRLWYVAQKTWVPMGAKNEKLKNIIFFIDAGKDLFAGNEEGLYVIQKPYAVTRLYPEAASVFIKKDAIKLRSHGLHGLDIQFEYRLTSFPDHWQKAEGIVQNDLFVWDIQDLPSMQENYEIRAVIRQNNEVTIGDACVIRYDVDPLRITCDTEAGVKQPGLYTLNGYYSTKNIETIIVYPYNIHALCNNRTQQFKAVINLKEGKNKIEVIGQDRRGRKARSIISLYATAQNKN